MEDCQCQQIMERFHNVNRKLLVLFIDIDVWFFGHIILQVKKVYRRHDDDLGMTFAYFAYFTTWSTLIKGF